MLWNELPYAQCYSSENMFSFAKALLNKHDRSEFNKMSIFCVSLLLFLVHGKKTLYWLSKGKQTDVEQSPDYEDPAEYVYRPEENAGLYRDDYNGIGGVVDEGEIDARGMMMTAVFWSNW